MAQRKAEEIFEYFARGSARLSVQDLIALHRATEDSGMPDGELKVMLIQMLE